MASAKETSERLVGGADETWAADAAVIRDSSKRVQPPNKKKHENELEGYSLKIKQLETDLKACTVKAGEARAIKAQKDKWFEKVTKLDQDLKTLNKKITEEGVVIAKLASSLMYRVESAVDQKIKRLHYLLQNNNYKIHEEKKIVQEIDALNRSKKPLALHTEKKREIASLREKQSRIREEIENCYKQLKICKSQEDELKRNMSSFNRLKSELILLEQQKTAIIEEFCKHREEFNAQNDRQRKQMRQENIRKREEEQKKERSDIPLPPRTTMAEEKIKLCNALQRYLGRYRVGNEATAQPDSATMTAGLYHVVTELDDGSRVLPKRQEVNLFDGLQRGRFSKRSKQKRKSSLTKKPITHTPEIFSQFESLTLTAPSTMSEVTASIEQLDARKEFFKMSEANKLPERSPSPSENVDSAIISRQSSKTDSNEEHLDATCTERVIERLQEMQKAFDSGVDETDDEKEDSIDQLVESNSKIIQSYVSSDATDQSENEVANNEDQSDSVSSDGSTVTVINRTADFNNGNIMVNNDNDVIHNLDNLRITDETKLRLMNLHQLSPPVINGEKNDFIGSDEVCDRNNDS